MNTQIRIAWTTTAGRAEAESLARGAVETGLAACAQVSGPIGSFYRWEGKLCHETEWRVTFKFAVKNAESLAAWISANHPYEVPQWVAVDASQVSPEYASWLLAEAGDFLG